MNTSTGYRYAGDLHVAQTIMQQLGGRGFALMTGAKDFVGNAKSVSFRLPGRRGFVRGGINVVVITLDPSDTYTIEFFRMRGVERVSVAVRRDVYCDGLREVFRDITGLETRLPVVRGLARGAI